MNRSRKTFPTLVRIGIVMLVFAAALLAVSCGKDGGIYGALNADGVPYGYVGGFPASISPNVYYKISEGTYEVAYYVFYLGAYYPATGYYYSTYTVTADKGSFLSDGKDKYFDLYLGYDGLYKSGEVRSAATPPDPTKTTPRLGTQSWTQDGLLITVTTEIRQATPDELSKIQKPVFQTKGN